MGDLDGFYAELRWPRWQDEISAAHADEGFALYPPPFAKEGKPVARASRKLVPITELWTFYRDVARQIGELAEGESFELRVDG